MSKITKTALWVVPVLALLAICIGLAWGVVNLFRSEDGPKTVAAKKELFKATDKRTAQTIRDKAGPQELRCDRYTPSVRFFDSISGESIIYVSKYDVTDSNGAVRTKYRCFDRDGINPEDGQELVETGRPNTGQASAIQQVILAQEPWSKFIPEIRPVMQARRPQSPRQRDCDDDCGHGTITYGHKWP